MINGTKSEKADLVDFSNAGALGLQPMLLEERAHAEGVYNLTFTSFKPEHEKEYIPLFGRLEQLKNLERRGFIGLKDSHIEVATKELVDLGAYLKTLEYSEDSVIHNVVCTAGKNFLLNNGINGSAYTAAFYMGLISSVSYGVGPQAGDTAASHAGWLEAGGTNAPAYSGTRKPAAWASASSGSIALSAGLVFTFTGPGTVKGCFMGTSNTIDSTTGTLLSAGTFSGGDQPVVATNTLTVSYSLGL